MESEDQETKKGAPWSGVLPKARESVEVRENLGKYRSRARSKSSELRINWERCGAFFSRLLDAISGLLLSVTHGLVCGLAC